MGVGRLYLYFDYFIKIDPTYRASRLFQAIPSELNKNASRYQVGSVLSDSEHKNLRLLSGKLSANLGYVYEKIVAQVITAGGNKLFYHIWSLASSNHNYEKHRQEGL